MSKRNPLAVLAIVVVPATLLASLAACEPSPRRDQPGQTTTTAASEADRKADELAEKTKKALVNAKEEVKEEWNKADVHLDTHGGAGEKVGAEKRDGGVSVKTR